MSDFKQPLLSIVTITRNNLSGLKLTLDSINTQRLPIDYWSSVEWVVIDGASTDGTHEYIAGISCVAKKCILSEPDKGIFDAMNKGLYLASGRYVLFLNSGDVFADCNVISSTLPVLKGEYEIVCGQVMTTSDGACLGLADLGKWLPHQGVFISRALHLEFPYDVNFKIFGDLDLWMRLSAASKFNPRKITNVISKMEMDGVGNHPKFLNRRIFDKIKLNIKHKLWVRLFADSTWLLMCWIAYQIGGLTLYQKILSVKQLLGKAFDLPWVAADRSIKACYSILFWPIRFLIYKDISPTAFIHPSVSIQNYNKTMLGPGIKINRNVTLWCSMLKVGSNTQINPNTTIYGNVEIGANVMIAPGVMIAGGNHRFDNCDSPMISQGSTELGIIIEEDVWVGANAVITDGVHIGKGAVIGAGAVVTGNIPALAIATGVPARVVRYRNNTQHDSIIKK